MSRMLQAFIKGKLGRDQENLEDILTSNAFGSFSYVPLEDGLLPFLSEAKNIKDEYLSESLNLKNIIKPPKYDFWPSLKEKDCEICEPDVIITFNHSDGTKSIVLIESKFKSGKSSEADENESNISPPKDQLAKEWHNLYKKALRENAKPFLIYVTADYSFPREEILETQKELERKNVETGKIYWLSWRSLEKTMNNTKNNHKIIDDLVKLLSDKLELRYFNGFTVNFNCYCDWRFSNEF
ncbi:MAG: hypothetical protein AB1742_03790 [bacterium]